MSQCPVCEANVTADFGLIECESCGAQLLVHMDGRLEYQGAESKQVLGAEPGGEEASPPPFEFVDSQNEVPAASTQSAAKIEIEDPENDKTQLSIPDFGPPPPPNEDGLFDFSSENTSQGQPQMPTAVAFAKDVAAMAGKSDSEKNDDELLDEALFGEDEYGEGSKISFPPSEAAAEDVQQADEHIFGEEPAANDVAEDSGAGGEAPDIAPPPADAVPEYNFDEPGGTVEPPPPVYNSAPGNSPDLSDVARFGNSDLAGSRDGALRYTLFIEGIDTSDVRAAFREAITDRKFVWDIDSILRQVRNGEVTIQNVAPSKAYILITRLRNLPIKVRWEQYAISQT